MENRSVHFSELFTPPPQTRMNFDGKAGKCRKEKCGKGEGTKGEGRGGEFRKGEGWIRMIYTLEKKLCGSGCTSG